MAYGLVSVLLSVLTKSLWPLGFWAAWALWVWALRPIYWELYWNIATAFAPKTVLDITKEEAKERLSR